MILLNGLYSPYAKVYQTAEEAINDANKFLQELMGITNYYRLTSNGKGLNHEFAKTSTPAFQNKPIFVYGSQVEASEAVTSAGRPSFVDINGKREYRAMGYARDGSAFGNPVFPPDNEGYLASDKKWIKKPWGDDGVRQLYDENGSAYTRHLHSGQYGGLDYINRWISFSVFQPDQIAIYTGKRNYFTPNIVGAPLNLKEDFHEFLYIIQPPTQHSWGLGIAFYYWDGYNRLNYRTFLLEPYALQQKDIAVDFETIPSRASEGQQVVIGALVTSTFDMDVDITYSWEIKDATGKDLSSQATYSGHGSNRSGTGKILKEGEVLYYAQLPMPASDVIVKFRAEGVGVEESNLENNEAEERILFHGESPPSVTNYDLDYHVLSRKINHPMINGGNITAYLHLPQGQWDGNATGSLNVSQSSQPEILQQFSVQNNPPVNEASDTIIRRPTISATVQRPSFGDNPKGGVYSSLPWVDKSPSIRYEGMVQRNYKYEVQELAGTDGEGNPIYITRTERRTTSSSFDNGTDVLNIRAYIYNGLKPQDMPYVAARNFKTVVENNHGTSNTRKMFWVSDPYDFDVIRWMCHIDENGNEYGYEEVDGQYKRRFTQQNTADINWSVLSSMASEYQSDRQAASNMVRDNNRYQKIVFATDRDLQRFDYPVKSGYYLNPAGSYSVTIKTEMYKNTTANTPEHADLVNRIINSFRYQSDLLYTHDGRNTYNVNLSSGNRNIGGHEMLRISQNYTKNYEEIQHSINRTNITGTHRFWKEILEGYSESNTSNSYNDYKYREHVKSGNIYKINEETTVTFTVNPNNRRLYTFANMQDSDRYGRDYYIRAWLADINLNNLTYNGLTIAGKPNQDSTALDTIRITVKGSMFDDLNN